MAVSFIRLLGRKLLCFVRMPWSTLSSTRYMQQDSTLSEIIVSLELFNPRSRSRSKRTNSQARPLLEIYDGITCIILGCTIGSAYILGL